MGLDVEGAFVVVEQREFQRRGGRWPIKFSPWLELGRIL
jgi:hypothetical protein